MIGVLLPSKTFVWTRKLLDEAKRQVTPRRLFISTEDANLNVGGPGAYEPRRTSVPVSSGIDSYRESPKNLPEVREHTDLILYDNPRIAVATASWRVHRRRGEQSRSNDTGLGCQSVDKELRAQSTKRSPDADADPRPFIRNPN